MSSSSSVSSHFTHQRQVFGVPTACWCGRKLRTYCSQTYENPFRRFYRCEIALQRKTEQHLFKWVDEALVDETRMVDAKLLKLVDEVKELRKEMVENFEFQKIQVLKMEEELKEKMMEELKEKMKEEMKKKIKGEMMMANKAIQEMAGELAKKSLERVGITVLVVGGIGWICGKFVLN